MSDLQKNNKINSEVFINALNSLSQWALISVSQRAAYVKKIREIIVERQDEILIAIVSDTQKPITEAVNQEITAALGMLKFLEKKYVKWLKPDNVYYFRPGFWTKTNKIIFEPTGIIGIIGPSNFPFSLPLMQSVSALLCGNPVILKPSEKSPATGKVLNKIFLEAGLPEGVVNLLFGDEDVARQIIVHKSVSKIIFTGSSATGRKIAKLCGDHFKTCILELGGNNPAIVCETANIKLAVKGIAWSALYSNSKSCVGTNIIFIHSKIFNIFLQTLVEEIKQIRIGNPFDPNTDFSDSECQELPEQSQNLLQEIKVSAEKVYLISEEEGKINTDGWNYPKVVINSKYINKILNEDFQFPVIFVQSFDSVEDTIQLINSSSFGLGASVWSRNFSEAREISSKLKMGMVWINDASVGIPQFPWGGTKMSGWGRLYARSAITELTNVKVVSCDHQLGRIFKTWWFPYSNKKFNIFLNINHFFGKNKIKALIKILKIHFFRKY